ncbi:MAG: hypothetical protein methR_P2197 [Methyloprofundus sp.]|nr:MAG: hypothetical protein methR_P2197 [Methyloprofundus sp.]
MSIKKYSILFVFLLVFISSLLAMANYVVDPYMLFQSKRIAGFNDKKPTVANRSTLYKPYNIANIKPKTIIVGNSRPEMGLDPNSACWPKGAATVYSLTFPGLSFYGQIRALYHGIATGQVEHIVLGVDFADFLHPKREFEGDFWPKRSALLYKRFLVDEQFADNNLYWLNKTKDYATALFSLDALNDSVTTLISQSPNSANRTKLGFNPARDYYEINRYEGAWVLFAQKQKELASRFSKAELSIFDTTNWSFELEAVKKAIQLAHDHNIRLSIFINAYHYTYLETIKTAGYWPEFEKFKLSLADTVKKYGNNQVALWDFALYSNYTVTAVPQKNTAKTDWHWFWEPAHYKAELGELMLADMFATSCTATKTDPVGIQLNTVNMNTHLLQQQKQRAVLLQNLF